MQRIPVFACSPVLLAVIISLAGTKLPVEAAEHHVPGQYATIQAAIDAAADGDEIVIAPGRYVGDGNRDLDFGGKAITVRSTNPSDPGTVADTVIDCQGTGLDPHRGFAFLSDSGGNSVVAGLTITNGYASNGGAVFCTWGHSPTIANCRIVGNSAENKGGGVYCDPWSSPEIRDCLVIGNSAGGNGGGICLAYENSPAISESVISGNSASYGAGISCYQGWPALTNCVIQANVGSGSGGGIWWSDSGPKINNTTLCHNAAGRGGGIYGYSDSYRDYPRINNCVIWGNSAADGPQIALGRSSYSATDKLTVSYCTVQGGAADVYVQPAADPDNPLVAWVVDWAGGNIDIDPLFVDPDGPDNNLATWQDNDYRLSPGSPCIDAGDNAALPGTATTDLDGKPRYVDDLSTPDSGAGTPPIVDMGAYEFYPLLTVEIEPEECPNMLNIKSRGRMSVAILGTPDVDLSAIDTASIALTRSDVAGSVLPEMFTIADVAGPSTSEPCACHPRSADGIPDLLLKFRVQDILSTLRLGDLQPGAILPLTVTVRLLSPSGSKVATGSDCITLVPR